METVLLMETSWLQKIMSKQVENMLDVAVS